MEPVTVTAIVTIIGWFVVPTITEVCKKYFPLISCKTTLEDLQTLKQEILPKLLVVIELSEYLHAVPDGLETWLTELKDAARKVEVALVEQKSGIRGKNRAIICFAKDKKVKPYSEDDNYDSDPDSSLNNNRNFEKPVPSCKNLEKSVQGLTKIGKGVDNIISLLNLCMNSNINRSMIVNPHSTISLPPPVVYGRDKDLQTLVDSLISKHDETSEPIRKNWRVPVVAIHGIGGAGKTTLAQYVFNDHQVIDHFGDYRMWVHVSHKFDVLTVMRKIIESATRAVCPRIENVEVIQRILGETLKSTEKFLLVLDDVWYEDWKDMEQLEQLLHPVIRAGGSESRILITTRTKRAASRLHAKETIYLEELNAKACMSIVNFYAFGGKDRVENKDLANLIDEQIVDKLKVSPLAARVIGTQLGSTDNPEAWRMILEGDILRQNVDLLLQTYKHLPWNLQQCFAITCLIPQGRKFKRADLVKLWRKRGLIESRNKVRLVGWPYFDDLLSYSFIQPLNGREADDEKLYTMNGLIHKVAEWISKDDSLRVDQVNLVESIPDEFLHISVDAMNLKSLVKKISKHTYLRTIMVIISSNEDRKHCEELVEKYKVLQERFQLLYFKAVNT